MGMSDEKKIAFQRKILSWWEENKRDLPWRKTTNPYFVMVSEIMLQQTQVKRTVEKYLEFIKRFPTIESLAQAKTKDILKIWSGLGYNRRAIWLQEAANQLMKMSESPKIPKELIKLKGIGPYTSKSILIFTFNFNLAAVDTNIRRILIAEGFATENMREKELYKVAEHLVPIGNARDWHNALMDYGSLVLTSTKTGIKPKTKFTKDALSNRYYRGEIVKILIQEANMTSEILQKKCNIDKSKMKKILAGLLKDKLIIQKGERYELP